MAEATTYYYRVRANGVAPNPGNSAWSNIATATTPGRLPIAPSNVRSGGSTRVSIIVGWKDNSTNETGFSVYRGATATGPWTLVTTTTANKTSTTVTGLIRGTGYYFQVIAINAYGSSAAAVSARLPTLP
jgi:titin